MHVNFEKNTNIIFFHLHIRINNNIKKYFIRLKETFFCKLILPLFTVCEYITKSIYRHYNFINSGENVIRSSHQFIK